MSKKKGGRAHKSRRGFTLFKLAEQEMLSDVRERQNLTGGHHEFVNAAYEEHPGGGAALPHSPTRPSNAVPSKLTQ